MRDEARRKRGSNREQKEAISDALRPCETIQVSPKVTDEVDTQKSAELFADRTNALRVRCPAHLISLLRSQLPLKGKPFGVNGAVAGGVVYRPAGAYRAATPYIVP